MEFISELYTSNLPSFIFLLTMVALILLFVPPLIGLTFGRRRLRSRYIGFLGILAWISLLSISGFTLLAVFRTFPLGSVSVLREDDASRLLFFGFDIKIAGIGPIVDFICTILGVTVFAVAGASVVLFLIMRAAKTVPDSSAKIERLRQRLEKAQRKGRPVKDYSEVFSMPGTEYTQVGGYIGAAQKPKRSKTPEVSPEANEIQGLNEIPTMLLNNPVKENESETERESAQTGKETANENISEYDNMSIQSNSQQEGSENESSGAYEHSSIHEYEELTQESEAADIAEETTEAVQDGITEDIETELQDEITVDIEETSIAEEYSAHEEDAEELTEERIYEEELTDEENTVWENNQLEEEYEEDILNEESREEEYSTEKFEEEESYGETETETDFESYGETESYEIQSAQDYELSAFANDYSESVIEDDGVDFEVLIDREPETVSEPPTMQAAYENEIKEESAARKYILERQHRAAPYVPSATKIEIKQYPRMDSVQESVSLKTESEKATAKPEPPAESAKPKKSAKTKAQSEKSNTASSKKTSARKKPTESTVAEKESAPPKNASPAPHKLVEIPVEESGLPVTKRYVITNRMSAVNIFSDYLNSKNDTEKKKLTESMNVITLK